MFGNDLRVQQTILPSSHFISVWGHLHNNPFQLKCKTLKYRVTCTLVVSTRLSAFSYRDGGFVFKEAKEIWTGCGSDGPPTVYSTGQFLWVRFYSNKEFQAKGFTMKAVTVSGKTFPSTLRQSWWGEGGVWSHLGCPKQNATIFSRNASFRVASEENKKTHIKSHCNFS